MYYKPQNRSIQNIVWGHSFSIVIVCILWMAFFSGELDWLDHYWSSRMAGLAHFTPVMQTICPEIV